MFEYVAPVARLKICGNGYGLFQFAVGVQVENDASGTGVAGIVVVLPEFLDGNVYISADVGVGHVVTVDGRFVTVNHVFLDGVRDLLAGAVVLRHTGEAPAPVSLLIRVYGERGDLGGTFHQVDRDVFRTDYVCDVFVADPFLVAFDIDDRGSVGERDRRVFVVFNRFDGGAQIIRRDRVVSGGGADRLVGNERERRNVIVAGLRHGVRGVFGQIRERRGLAVCEGELFIPVAVGERRERILGRAYGIGIGGVGRQAGERNVEAEFGRVVRVGAFAHLRYFESARGRIELGIGYDRGNGRFCRLTGLAGVAYVEAFNVSLFDLVPERQRCAVLEFRGKSGDVDGLVFADHRRADAVCEVNVAEQSGDAGRNGLKRAVGVKRDSHGELAGEIFFRKGRFAVGGEHLGDREADRYGNFLVVFNGDRYVFTVFGERSGTVGDSDLEALRIGLGDDVGYAGGEVGKRYDAVILKRNIGFAVYQRNVSVKCVGYRVVFKIRYNEMEDEFRIVVFDAGHYFIDGKAYVIGNYFCIGDLYAVFAGLVFDQSVGGLGSDRAAGGVMDRDGIFDRAVGFITRQRAFPEIIRSVYVVDFKLVFPGAVFELDPLGGIAGVADVLRRRGVVFGRIVVGVDHVAFGREGGHDSGSRYSVAEIRRHRIIRERRDCRSSLLCEVARQRGVRRERAVVLVVFRMRGIVSVVVKERTAGEHQIARRCAASVGRADESVFVRPFGARVDRCKFFAILEHPVDLRWMFRRRCKEAGEIDLFQFFAFKEHLVP